MKVYIITTPDGQEFCACNAATIAKAPVGSVVQIKEMTEAEFMAVPATTVKAAFGRKGKSHT